MCVIINPDIVIAAEISEIWTSIGFKEKDLHKRIDRLTRSKISIRNCFLRQEESKEEAGLGNMIAESREEHYRSFIEKSDLFIWVAPDHYQIRQDCKLLQASVTDTQQKQWDIRTFFSHLLKTKYDEDTLIAFNII